MELWHRSGLVRQCVARGRTDQDGNLNLELEGVQVGEHLELRVLEEKSHFADGDVVVESAVSWRHALEVDGEETDVGALAVPYWPYRTDFPTPRVADVDGKLPQRYSPGFLKTLLKAVVSGAPRKNWLHAQHKLNPRRPGPTEIQAGQAHTLTLRIDEEAPGTSRSDAWLGDQLLNGFDVTLAIKREQSAPGRYRAVIDWGEFPRPARMFDLTDFDVLLEERGGNLLPIEIALKVRRPQEDGTWAVDEVTVGPDDERWSAAKRAVRSTYLLHGATDAHITLTHLQTEMYAVAVFRNLRLSPVRALLEPHLQEIVAQDHDGDNFAWGYHGIISVQGALTPAFIEARMRRATAARCWRTFRPRAPICEGHRYAKAANLYWDVLGDYLDEFFAANEAAIVDHWREVHAFSNDLVRNSLVYEPTNEPGAWVDASERDDPSVPRVEVDGALRSVRPVSTSDTPAEGDLDALRQLCRYVLFQCTFNHSWAHDGQYDAGGELTYATFGLRNGSLGPDDDENVLPPPDLNIESLCTNTLGTKANYGYILADEDSDVPPQLKRRLEEQRAAFDALGVPAEKIRSRINI